LLAVARVEGKRVHPGVLKAQGKTIQCTINYFTNEINYLAQTFSTWNYLDVGQSWFLWAPRDGNLLEHFYKIVLTGLPQFSDLSFTQLSCEGMAIFPVLAFCQ
jgi:hypothetical protein